MSFYVLPFDVCDEFVTPSEYKEFHISVCESESSVKTKKILKDFLAITTLEPSDENDSIDAAVILDEFIRSIDEEKPESIKKLNAFKGCGRHNIPLLSLLAMKADYASMEFLLPLIRKRAFDINQLDIKRWGVLHHLSASANYREDPLLEDERLRIARDLIELGAEEGIENESKGTAQDILDLIYPKKTREISGDAWHVPGLTMSRDQIYQYWNNMIRSSCEGMTIADINQEIDIETYYESKKQGVTFTHLEDRGDVLGLCNVASIDIPKGTIFEEYGGELATQSLAKSHYIDTGIIDHFERPFIIDGFNVRSNGACCADGPPNTSLINAINCKGAPWRIFFVATQAIKQGDLITQDYGGANIVKDNHQEIGLERLQEYFSKSKGRFFNIFLIQSQLMDTLKGSDLLCSMHKVTWMIYTLHTPVTLFKLIHSQHLFIEDLKIIYRSIKLSISPISTEIVDVMIPFIENLKKNYSPTNYVLIINCVMSIIERNPTRLFILAFLRSLNLDIRGLRVINSSNLVNSNNRSLEAQAQQAVRSHESFKR